MLKVGGFVPFSTTDWPDHLASVVFVQGCPWRCHYCHNPELQSRDDSGQWSWPKLLDRLAQRHGLLDGVVFSGGEATLDRALPEAMQAVRHLGLKVGLHTAGIYPNRLSAALPFADWVGLDVKGPFETYSSITGTPNSAAPARESLARVMASGVAYELRTTFHPTLLNEAMLHQIARTLNLVGARKWTIQSYTPPQHGPSALGPARHTLPHRLKEQLEAEGIEIVLR